MSAKHPKKVKRPMQQPGLLATESQVYRLVDLGIPREEAEMMTRGEAHLRIGEYFKGLKQERECG